MYISYNDTAHAIIGSLSFSYALYFAYKVGRVDLTAVLNYKVILILIKWELITIHLALKYYDVYVW